MTRPRKHRRVRCMGMIMGFAPIKPSTGSPINLGLDHLEALRLHDLDGLDQEQAAARMEVSRQTLGRILKEAHRAIVEAIVTDRGVIFANEHPIKVTCEEFGHRYRHGRQFHGGGMHGRDDEEC